jgi:phage-related protein (TIGR01555 family)
MATTDGLRNAMSGLGGDADKLTGTAFIHTEMSQQQLEAAYRSDWITRKGIDIPAFDATREWRSWQADPDAITKIEGLEKKFMVQRKVMMSLQRARLYGGGALVIGADDGQTFDKPLNLDRLREGSLKFLHSVSRHELSSGPLVTDIMSEFYGQPEYFTASGSLHGTTLTAASRIHPSRIVRFVGAPVLNNLTQPAGGWGDSVLQVVQEAVVGAGLVTNSVAQMVAETKIDIIKIPGLSKNIATEEYENDLKARFTFSSVAKSVYRTLVMDKDEEWQRIEANFNTLPDIQKLFLLIVSGAFDIPVTRFLGQSPAGLSATGDSDTRNYYDRCSSHQKNEIQPELKRLDDVLIRCALGGMKQDRVDEIFYNWNPLWQLTDAEKATMWKNKADIAQIDLNMGLINEVVLKKAREAQLIEDGTYPGFQALLDEWDDDPNLDNQEEEDPPVDPNIDPNIDPNNPEPGAAASPPATAAGSSTAADPQSARGGAPVKKTKGKNQSDAIRAMSRRVRDASSTPRSLYVRRDVLNADDIVSWAKSQGFESVVEDLHVTIIYSKTPVDWLKIGSDDWSSDEKGNLEVKSGGPRVIEKFGEGAVVLAFSNSSLQYRNMAARENGASWDHEDYTPHITITHQPPLGLDLSKVQPYTGRILLGPEIFEEIKGAFNPSEVES